MFYLKYRPKTIEELDNLKVKEIMKKILSAKTLPHAFLFIGQKGTGKTSTARIFAKAVNCLNVHPRGESQSKEHLGGLKTIEPCNRCKNCLAIDSFSSPDIIELDAASNRGIEDVKKLIKESNFFPMSNKYRVYIIDEAHMITNDAFNALLKTLEEPPASVIFVLATTNQEKIPETIQSRCLTVNFGSAKKSEIVSMLKKITAREKLNLDEKLLTLIAQHSDNSFRDAAKILEELVTQKKFTYEAGKHFLGLLQENFFEAVYKQDLQSTLNWIENFSESGGNFKNLIEHLLAALKNALLQKNGITTEDTFDLNLETRDIITLMKLLTEAYNNLKISPIESLPLEIAVVEFYNKKSEARNPKS